MILTASGDVVEVGVKSDSLGRGGDKMAAPLSIPPFYDKGHKVVALRPQARLGAPCAIFKDHQNPLALLPFPP